MFGVEENFGEFGKSLVTCQILPSNSNNVSCDINHYLKCLQVVSVYSKVFRSQVGRSANLVQSRMVTPILAQGALVLTVNHPCVKLGQAT